MNLFFVTLVIDEWTRKLHKRQRKSNEEIRQLEEKVRKKKF